MSLRESDPELRQLLQRLEQAERLGAAQDVPEGARYIKVSETLVQVILTWLRRTQELSR